MSNFCDIQITLAGKDAPLRTSQIVYFSSVIATKNKRQWTIHYSNRYFFLFVFFLLSNQLFYRLKMLRGPLFPKHTFHFISLFCASSINTPETTLVGVRAVKLKKKRSEPFCSCLSSSFYFPAFVLDERLITIICFNASSCCSISFHARISKDAQLELFVLSSLTTFARYSLLLVGIKQILHFHRHCRRGFYPSCHSRSFILHLDLLSRQNTQRAWLVGVLMFCHLPFLIEGCPMPCLSFSLHPPSLVIFLLRFRSSFQEDSKFTSILF